MMLFNKVERTYSHDFVSDSDLDLFVPKPRVIATPMRKQEKDIYCSYFKLENR